MVELGAGAESAVQRVDAGRSSAAVVHRDLFCADTRARLFNLVSATRIEKRYRRTSPPATWGLTRGVAGSHASNGLSCRRSC